MILCLLYRNIHLLCTRNGCLGYCHHYREPPPTPQSGPNRSAQMAQVLYPYCASESQLSQRKGQRPEQKSRGFPE